VWAAIRQFRDEAQAHEFYFQLVRDWLSKLASSLLTGRGVVPYLDLCFDFNFQFSSRHLVNLLLRGQFYTTFAAHPEHHLREIFGLVSQQPFRARIAHDSYESEPGLYLADIYAHAWGCIEKGRDPDGRYGAFSETLAPIQRS